MILYGIDGEVAHLDEHILPNEITGVHIGISILVESWECAGVRRYSMFSGVVANHHTIFVFSREHHTMTTRYQGQMNPCGEIGLV